MHIRKFDHDYFRRAFLSKAAGFAGAGILAPLWPLIAQGQDTSKAYPEELRSIEGYTKGKIKTGDIITAANVEYVKNLLTPIAYIQVKDMGRRIRIVKSTTDVSKLFPQAYYEATIKNAGKAKFGPDGNVYGPNGERWMGGNPFPDAKTSEEAYANLTLSFSRYNNATFAMKDHDINPDGTVGYEYNWMWYEENTSGRLGAGGPYGPYGAPEFQDKLRFNTVLFTSPSDIKGTAFLNTWYYDQKKFPDLVGYVPAFKRVRKFPTNQRFEPLVPGFSFYLSDAWCAGDPMLTWGNYKLVGRQPMLGAVSHNQMDNPNWDMKAHGGPKGESFYELDMELIPECLVCDAEPTGFPRAPVSKKRTWLDARNMMFVGYHTYDRRGELWKSVEASFSRYEKGNFKHMTDGSTTWSWTTVMSHDIQSNRISRFTHNKEVDGIKSTWNVDGLYSRAFTDSAISRMGT